MVKQEKTKWKKKENILARGAKGNKGEKQRKNSWEKDYFSSVLNTETEKAKPGENIATEANGEGRKMLAVSINEPYKTGFSLLLFFSPSFNTIRSDTAAAAAKSLYLIRFHYFFTPYICSTYVAERLKLFERMNREKG